ncbi:hypothetical protein IWW47_000011 [Coemansia sp. RSA 2052]|nr:hypothetical protein IWW47_000011 [Coemansia sp. RSA 2052]
MKAQTTAQPLQLTHDLNGKVDSIMSPTSLCSACTSTTNVNDSRPHTPSIFAASDTPPVNQTTAVSKQYPINFNGFSWPSTY